MKKANVSISELHGRLDENGDGSVDKREFVTRMNFENIPGLVPQDLGSIFDALDVNGDGALSLMEFGLYLEGASINRAEKVKKIDPEIQRAMKDEIKALFDSFDQDGDGQITAQEICRTLQSFGIRKTIDQCKEMIRGVSGNSTALDRV